MKKSQKNKQEIRLLKTFEIIEKEEINNEAIAEDNKLNADQIKMLSSAIDNVEEKEEINNDDWEIVYSSSSKSNNNL